VTIALPTGVEFLAATIAVWKCGATPQPISAKLPHHEAAAIIDLAQPSLVIGLDQHDVPDISVIPSGFEPSPGIADTYLDVGAAAEWKAPTSGGSSGRPKLIVSTEPAVAATVEPFARLMGVRDNDTLLITAPLYHNGPFLMSACGLTLGAHVVLVTRFDAAETLRIIERHRVEWMYVVPTMMMRIWRLEERESFDVRSLRVVAHTAAPCPAWLKQGWIDWLGADRILELYGSTELQAATLLTGDEWLARPGTVGKPAIGEMTVLDETGSPLASGNAGEIWMRRAANAQRPYRYIGAVAQSRQDGWETFGDMGWMDDEGYVYLADRKADMIIVGGANVYPAEVEGALLEHPLVRSAVVVGRSHEDLGQVPHAFVELASDLDEQTLLAHLATRIARYKMPRSFERVDEPLRDNAGKVRRSALAASAATFTPPPPTG